MIRHDIRNLLFEELKEYLCSLGQKPFRASQIFEDIYKKGASSFDEMKNLPKDLLDRLQKDFEFYNPAIVQRAASSDGTTKFLLDLYDHQKIETVLIPSKARVTVCVSSQAGCKFGCRFCASGIGGWVRNLSTAEILSEILCAKGELMKRKRVLSHIVFMGTGENLDNYENLMKAIRIINAKEGFNIGARRITISTVGIIPKILQLAKENIQVELAISLHGYDNESRNVLMPVNRKYPFDELMAACREYVKLTKRQITFEYILIKDLTCTPEALENLRKAFAGIICKMNLIPYNPVKEFSHQTSTYQEMVMFQKQLERIGIHSTIRTPRGKDVAAACGQLRHEASEKSG